MPQAIEVFKLNVSLYPDAWNTYDSLADGYRVNGQKDLAIKFYKKAIEMNPEDVNGVARLKDLLSSDEKSFRSALLYVCL